MPKLSDLVNIFKGKQHKFIEGGTVPIYSIGKMEGYTDKSICNVSCIAIGASGTIGKPRLYNPPYWITGTQIYLTAKEGVNLEYLFYYLDNIDYKPFKTVGVRTNLELALFSKLEVNYPNNVDYIVSKMRRIYEQIAKEEAFIQQAKDFKNCMLNGMFPHEETKHIEYLQTKYY